MDRLVAEPEIKTEVETQKELQSKEELSIKISSAPPKPTGYLSTLENMTIADFKKKEEDKRVEAFQKEKEVLIQEIYASEKEETIKEEKTEKQVSQNIIEKPNYDFIEENKKVVKLKRKSVEKRKEKKKIAGIALACALGASAIICVTNCVIVDNMASEFIQIDETYKLNLQKYLKNIYNLDNAKNGMELIETYPEDLLDAGDTGEKSNWFDRFCNFIGGMFGG